MKGTQIILNEINSDSKNIRNKDKNLVENGDIEKCNAIESCDKICDIKTSDSSDKINNAPNKETIAQLDGASDCDIDEATPSKKRKLDNNDETKDKNTEENTDEKTSESEDKVSGNDEKSVEITENLEKSAESNKNTSVITETTENVLNESSDDVVMLSSDEEYVQPPSPKYKVPEEEVCYFYYRTFVLS